jgi:ATP-dependent DNA ligase
VKDRLSGHGVILRWIKSRDGHNQRERLAPPCECKLGLDGIVSKRRDAPYRHCRNRAWLKFKNPASPAAMRIVRGKLLIGASSLELSHEDRH